MLFNIMVTFFAEKSGALFDFACFENRRWEYHTGAYYLPLYIKSLPSHQKKRSKKIFGEKTERFQDLRGLGWCVTDLFQTSILLAF